MTVASTAKRRRRQAKNRYRHLAVHGVTSPNRPKFPKAMTPEKSAARLRKLIQTEQRIKQGKKK